MTKDFYVYMLSAKKNGTIYKGMTSDLLKRTCQHKNNIGSQFTKKYNVKNLVWYKQCGNWEDAVQWEKRLRRYSRQWKINLIEEENPQWNDLYADLLDYTDKPCNDGVKLREISQKLNSPLEARMFIKHITNLTDSDLIGMDTIPLTQEQRETLDDFIGQRLKGRPVSKIIGEKEFYGRVFHVTNDVLDPRPETEQIIDEAISFSKGKGAIRILDLGTGSGCILTTLLNEIPNATGVGGDISDAALKIAQQNAQALNVADRAEFIQSNWFESIEGSFDIIVTNPPYIETRTVEKLDKDVRDYDPMIALDGGKDGLTPYKVILPQIRNHLNPAGLFMCEHGTGQSPDIERLMENAGFEMIRVHHDLAGHDRCVSGLIPQK